MFVLSVLAVKSSQPPAQAASLISFPELPPSRLGASRSPESLAYIVQEYYDILHKELPKAQYIDYAGKYGRIQVKPSEVPLLISWLQAGCSFGTRMSIRGVSG